MAHIVQKNFGEAFSDNLKNKKFSTKISLANPLPPVARNQSQYSRYERYHWMLR